MAARLAVLPARTGRFSSSSRTISVTRGSPQALASWAKPSGSFGTPTLLRQRGSSRSAQSFGSFSLRIATVFHSTTYSEAAVRSASSPATRAGATPSSGQANRQHETAPGETHQLGCPTRSHVRSAAACSTFPYDPQGQGATVRQPDRPHPHRGKPPVEGGYDVIQLVRHGGVIPDHATARFRLAGQPVHRGRGGAGQQGGRPQQCGPATHHRERRHTACFRDVGSARSCSRRGPRRRRSPSCRTSRGRVRA